MNWRNTLVLVAVFAILAGYAFFVQKPKNESVTPTPSVEYLWQVDSTDVQGIRVMDHVNDKSVAFGRDDSGRWSITEPAPAEADQTTAETQSFQVQNLRIVQSLDGVADLSQFGVTQPAYTIEVTTGSQGTLIAHIGGKSPLGNGYYAIRPGDSTAVVISSSAVDGLLGLIDNPPYVVPTDTPVPVDTPTDVPATSATGSTPEPGGTSTPVAVSTATP